MTYIQYGIQSKQLMKSHKSTSLRAKNSGITHENPPNYLRKTAELLIKNRDITYEKPITELLTKNRNITHEKSQNYLRKTK